MWTNEEMLSKMGIIHNINCEDFMRNIPDKYFDLILTSPPYGLKIIKNGSIGINNNTKKAKVGDYSFTNNDWDKHKPNKVIFHEIFRISKNQIIFGANHFIESMPKNSSCWLVWDKNNETSSFADCELAWTSFKTAVRKYTFRWNGMLQNDMRFKEPRYHPAQNPVTLYKDILRDYIKDGKTIFDPFMGSGTTAIASKALGLDWCGCELQPEYVKICNERLALIQPDMFGV
jgi:site-specific DNA-methyltransferase (adenine-specific)